LLSLKHVIRILKIPWHQTYGVWFNANGYYQQLGFKNMYYNLHTSHKEKNKNQQ